MSDDYVTHARGGELPRIPLKASIDLTYRCNNVCRHCWLWAADTAEERARELTTAEWIEVVDQARALGTREWAISGGEPMLRDDFAEIFHHVTTKATAYSLNTNGTLITPEIARLLRRKGSKMVAVYGATADVYDHVTRNPGGFEALLRGLHNLKDAGAGFTVQLIPMRDNWGQWDEMVAFAKSWSRHWRVGAAWLFASACGDANRNAAIARQRLDPADVVELDRPDMRGDGGGEEAAGAETGAHPQPDAPGDDRLYAACIEARRDFHVDPYGGLSFCCFVKDPELRYDLRQGRQGAGERPGSGVPPGAGERPGSGVPPGAVQDAWEQFIPSLAERVGGGREYLEGCGACDLRADCKWCDVYGYLEHGRHGAKVEHLCAVAAETRALRDEWARDHRRYYEIAGITVQVESDLPFSHTTMDARFESFRRQGPGDDTVVIRHHFGLPDGVPGMRGAAGGGARGGEEGDGAVEVYRKPPWAIYRHGGSWIYEGISPDPDDDELHRVAVFDAGHARGEIYSPERSVEQWRAGGLGSLTLLPSDQILLARLLADREGCILHSGGMIVDGRGLLFVGHSDAGKSTTMELVRAALGGRADILCDDRNVVRRWPDGFRVHGTWSHGDVPDVSSASAPLHAVLFLEQATVNEIVPLDDGADVLRRLLATLIRALESADWWHRQLDVLQVMVREAACYRMRFDRSGAIVPELEKLIARGGGGGAGRGTG